MKGSLASWCVTGSMQWFIRAFLLLLKTGDQTTEDVYDKTKMVVLHLRATKKKKKTQTFLVYMMSDISQIYLVSDVGMPD